jgi:hypothetical protein
MRIACCFVLLVLVAPASAVFADDVDGSAEPPTAAELREAQQLFRQGVRRAQQERWAEALELFRQSREIVDRPSTVFNMAVSMHRLGRFREALVALDEFLALSDSEADAADRATAAELRPELLTSLVTLRLVITPAEAAVEVDGEPAAGTGARRELVLDPGDHLVTVIADGHETARVRISALGGDAVDREIALTSLTSVQAGDVPSMEPLAVDTTAVDREPSDSVLEQWWFWTAIGVVVASAATGIVLLSSSGGDDAGPVPGDDGVLVFTLDSR